VLEQDARAEFGELLETRIGRAEDFGGDRLAGLRLGPLKRERHPRRHKAETGKGNHGRNPRRFPHGCDMHPQSAAGKSRGITSARADQNGRKLLDEERGRVPDRRQQIQPLAPA
jgi:hypothetical protein